MFGKVSFVAVLMILSAMVFASLKGPRVNDFVANGSDHSSNILPSRRPQRIPGMGETGSGLASLGDSSLPGAGGIAPPAATARPAPVAVAPPQVAAPPDSSDQQMNSDDNSNDSDSNDNDNNDSSDDQNSNDDNDNNSGDQAMNNQGGDEQSNNPFTQEVPPGMMRTPNGQLMPLITPPAIAPFPPRLRNN
jgi:hypothetical protein